VAQVLTGWMSFLSPSQQCQSTEGNTKHCCQLAEITCWRHCFFIDHQTSDGRMCFTENVSVQCS